MKPRHTEEVAAETLLDLTKQIQLVRQPTAAEIEEALRLVRTIEVTVGLDEQPSAEPVPRPAGR